jgi:hypothetical protein
MLTDSQIVLRVSGEIDEDLMTRLDDRRVRWRDLDSLLYESTPALPRHSGPPKTVFIVQDTARAEEFYNTYLMPAQEQQEAGALAGYKGVYEVAGEERATYELKAVRFYRCGA